LSEQIATGKMTDLLPTPDHNDGNGGARINQNGHQITISDKVGQTGQGTGKKLRLQPAMTEWMMGFPENWVTLPLALQDGVEKPSKPTVTQ